MADKARQEERSEGDSDDAGSGVEENIWGDRGQPQEQEHVEKIMPILFHFVLQPGQLFGELSFDGIGAELAGDVV